MTEQELSPSVLSVGEQFRQAREKLGLSLEAAAKKANLRTNILEHIENNEFSHKKIPATFMKGYVRSYAKLLKLPENVWASAVGNFGDVPKHDFNRATRADRVTNPHSHHRWVGYLTTFVVIIALGMTALWWWESYQQSNTERDHLVQSYTPTTVEAEANRVTNNIPTLEVTTDAQSEPTAVKVENHEQSVAVAPLAQTEPTTQQLLSVPTETVQPVASSAVENTQENQPVAAVNGDLQIEVTNATSWISVKDTNRKVLAQKEYKKGEVLSFNAGAPYAVIIGAPSNVKITYKGENYPLKVDGRIAKFKLQ